MCDKVVDDFLLALIFLLFLAKVSPTWFVISKKMKNFMMFYSQMMVYSFLMKILIMSFCSDEMVILSVDLNNINLGGVNFFEDDPKTIIHVGYMTWRNRLKQRKAFKKDISKD